MRGVICHVSWAASFRGYDENENFHSNFPNRDSTVRVIPVCFVRNSDLCWIHCISVHPLLCLFLSFCQKFWVIFDYEPNFEKQIKIVSFLILPKKSLSVGMCKNIVLSVIPICKSFFDLIDPSEENCTVFTMACGLPTESVSDFNLITLNQTNHLLINRNWIQSRHLCQ